MIFLIVRLFLVASLFLSIYTMVVTLERCRSEKRYGFFYCCVAVFLYTLGYFVEVTSGNLGGGIIGVKILYAGGNFIAPFFFFFVADYCEVRLPKKFYRLPMLIIPILFYLVVLSFDHHSLLYSEFFYDTERTIPGIVIEPAFVYFIGAFYPVFCIAMACIVLINKIIKQKKQRLGLILLMLSALAPLIGNLSYVAISFFTQSALAQINFTAFLMVLTNYLFFYNIVRNDMFDLAPKAHAVTLDMIRDIFIVLDQNMFFTGSNSKAMELFPALTVQYKGKSILDLETWPQELRIEEKKSYETYNENSLREIEFTLSHKPGRNYSAWLNRVASKSGITMGWVILIQDVTETVRMTAALKFFNEQLQKAFSTYLSEDVVKEIIDDPTKLQLGGVKRHMTAMFTDIKDFSKIAEESTPEHLVELLNHYLSAMSDVILEQKGTIDKYEGDAILAFFGAPQQLPDHALRTCTAAILMKRLEVEVNKLLAEKDLCSRPVFTRIGINTGDMVAGNMGTQKKMNYTVIGNEVNLAARLEGVNKQYGTSIITSENTINETGGKLLSRRLGWIRVVGINKPVRIYEILDLMNDAKPPLRELVELFHNALDIYESRDWKNAENAFNKILEQFPDDNPSKLYLKYCRQFDQYPPRDDWDGVFDMREK